jgi:hypothetical protein
MEQAQKLELFLMSMPFLTKTVDLAVGRIESGKQGWRCHCVCSRGSESGCARASAADPVGYDLKLGSGFSRPRTVPARVPTGSDKDRRCLPVFLRTRDRVLILKFSTRCGFRPWLRQIRRTLASLMSTVRAMLRVLQ